MALRYVRKALFSVSEDGEKTVFRTERVVLEADSKNGGFVWRNADDGRVLLKEGRKELTEAPLMVYSTGGEELLSKEFRP